MPLFSFPRVNGEPNTIGYTNFYFIPKRSVVSIPLATRKALQEDIITTENFYAGYSVFGQLEFKDDPERTSAGNKFNLELTGVAPVDKPDYLYLFEQMSSDEYIILLRTSNDQFKLLGDQEHGLKFSYKTEGVGYTFSFTGQYDYAPPFYFGRFIVDGTVLESNYLPGVVFTVGGYWLFGDEPPVSGIGKNGDGYFDSETKLVYEKQANAWIEIGYLGVDQEIEETAIIYAWLGMTGNGNY